MNILNNILMHLVAFLAIFVQCAYSGLRELLGVQVDLLPPLMVYAGVTAGLGSITGLAVVGGLLFDSLSANPLGVTILPLFLIGLLIHQNRVLILKDQIYAQFILGVAASAFAPLLGWVLIKTAGEVPLVSWFSIWDWLVISLAGGAATPLLFLFFGRLHRAFDYQPMAQVSFRTDREIKRGRQINN